MKKIAVVGSTNIDMIIKSKKIPLPGETVGEGEFSIANGGKGANQAVAAARAGGDVTFISCVGDDDFGKKQLEKFKVDHINLQYVFIEKNTATGVALIMVDEKGENSISVAPGANGRMTKEHLKKAKEAISSSEIVLLQLEVPIETVKYAIDMAYEMGKKVILNPAPARKIDDEVISKLHTLIVNETEAEILSGLKVDSDQAVKEAADKLLEKGPDNVIITLGAKGSYILNRAGSDFVPGFKVKAVDTTAAGDVFCGTFCVALSKEENIINAVKYASAAAALSVTKLGAQPSAPYIKEIDLFFEKM